MTPPVFAHGHLRLYLLRLLDERPMHGYELIQSLVELFGGSYTPSAGTIYPRLAKLEEEGLVTKSAEGRKTVYAITEAGRAELRSREGEFDRIETEVTDSVRRLADEVRSSVDQAMRSLRADLAAAARESAADARRAERDASRATAEARTDARLRLHEAEALIAEFRAELRTDLRAAAAADRLPAEAVDRLRDGLRGLGREVRETLTR